MRASPRATSATARRSKSASRVSVRCATRRSSSRHVMGFHDLDLSERRLIARRGTAFFAQRLAELTDDDLESGSLLDGWTRKHLVAHVGYNAAALCRLMDWAATGEETPMYASPEQRTLEINEGATLSAAALRNLFDHTVARLNQKWRQLPASAWNASVRTAQGRLVPASETTW